MYGKAKSKQIIDIIEKSRQRAKHSLDREAWDMWEEWQEEQERDQDSDPDDPDPEDCT